MNRIETVGDVKSRQVLWVDWMMQSTDGLGDSDLVETTTDVTPWGNYLTDIRPARKCQGECGEYLLRSEFSEDPDHTMCDEDFAEYAAMLENEVSHR